MQVFPDFENEIKLIDSRLSIVPNNNYPQLANIKLDGVDVCPIPAHDIREESDPSYTIEFANGFRSKHRSRPEAIDRVNAIIEMIKTKEGADIFFNR